MASDSRRVLITGASGLLGRALMKAFSSSLNWQVLGLAHTRVSGNLQKVNLLDFEETRRIVEEFKPHLLVHSAAERRPDIVEKNPDATQNLNVGTTEFLAKLVEDFNKGLKSPSHFMLYISTDYVFDGTSAVPYKPDDPPHPINKYGQSKLEGEQAVERYHPNGLILRVPVLYGDVEHLGESSVSDGQESFIRMFVSPNLEINTRRR
ncbi:hypothetical protein QZH41_005693 [Actinostola sp. cb2023]|nr:hypothetical protein QZH41_005693 [Actinostola sp. cb2023]